MHLDQLRTGEKKRPVMSRVNVLRSRPSLPRECLETQPSAARLARLARAFSKVGLKGHAGLVIVVFLFLG